MKDTRLLPHAQFESVLRGGFLFWERGGSETDWIEEADESGDWNGEF